MTEVETILPRVSFLRGANEDVHRDLGRLAVPHTYPKGNLIYYHGEPCSALLIVVSGRVKISLFSEEGREVILTVVRPGGVIALDSALVPSTYFGTCTTLVESRLARVSRDAFIGWVQRNPAIQEPLLVEFSRRLRYAYEKIGELALLPVKKRLLMALQEIARAEGVTGSGGVVSFVRPTHQELAELVGSTRVVISRLLKELMEEEHTLASQGNVIRITLDDLVLSEDGAEKAANAGVTKVTNWA